MLIFGRFQLCSSSIDCSLFCFHFYTFYLSNSISRLEGVGTSPPDKCAAKPLYIYTHTALFLMLCHPFGRSSNNNNSTLLLLRVGMRSFVIWSSFYVTSPAAFKLQGVQTRNVQSVFQFSKKSVMYGLITEFRS